VLAVACACRATAVPHPFTPQDARLALAISHGAATAIQQSRLRERARALEQLASVDSLTGVDTRRRFYERA
jgi:PleD family two-component response regulator